MNKKKSKQKFKPLSEATLEEMQEAFLMGGLWITSELEGHTETGAFSEENLGIPAVEYFPMRAYATLKDPNCNWGWKKGTKLSTLFINVMKSDMAHTLRDYMECGEPMVMPASYLEREDEDDGWDDSNGVLEMDPDCFRFQGSSAKFQGSSYMSDMELLEELEQKETRHNRGYKIARAAAKGDPMLEQYVELAFTLPDHRAISKKLRKTKPQVLEIEAELIARIKVMLKK